MTSSFGKSTHEDFELLRSEYKHGPVHGVLTLLNTPHLWAFFPTWANTSTVAQSIKSSRRSRSMAFEKSELSDCWQMHRYYIYNKYFVNNLATLFFYQKSFINNNIVSKIKCIYWFNYKIVSSSQKKSK